jgi:hypothetical protein
MKKQYINPKTKIIVLFAQSQLMTGSDFTMELKTDEVSDETLGFDEE